MVNTAHHWKLPGRQQTRVSWTLEVVRVEVHQHCDVRNLLQTNNLDCLQKSWRNVTPRHSSNLKWKNYTNNESCKRGIEKLGVGNPPNFSTRARRRRGRRVVYKLRPLPLRPLKLTTVGRARAVFICALVLKFGGLPTPRSASTSKDL